MCVVGFLKLAFKRAHTHTHISENSVEALKALDAQFGEIYPLKMSSFNVFFLHFLFVFPVSKLMKWVFFVCFNFEGENI